MSSKFSLQSSIDCDELEENEKFNNLLGFKRFKHTDTSLNVNFADVAGPLFTMAVVVPTFLKDNKGKAHTLEHLIFTGSEKYPQRGLLDKLATSCMSSGTNAYTSDDHTNYTFSTGSADGLQKLLPVFLDHILHPRIVPETVDMEVFSLKVEKDADNESGPKVSGQGVVYCEMKGRQNSEADLMDYNLRVQLCNRFERENPAIFSRFKYECGGLTKDIAILSLEEIAEFHQQFYNPSNISIIICGKMNLKLEDELLFLVDSVLKPSNSYVLPQKFIPPETVSLETNGSIICHFPSNEENLGSIGFAWIGALAKDLTKVLTFHVIFKYLRETSSSPLYQKFVQVENSWATDIDYEIKPFYQTFMTLIFSGVPFDRLKPTTLRKMMIEFLAVISKDTDQFGQMIKFCLSSFELKLIELIEDDPYETIVSYTVPEIIVATIDGDNSTMESFGKSISSLKQTISSLKSQPIEYWLSHLAYLIDNEPIEVILKPSAKLDEAIESEEKDFLRKLWESNKARVAEIPEVVPHSIDGNFELMTDSQMTPYTKYFSSEGIHLIELPGTGMKQILRLVNFKNFIPENLWPYLVLYQELLFQCDVDLMNSPEIKRIFEYSDDKISYQLLQKILNARFNSYGINFGLENDIFSLGYCEEAMTWTMTLPSSSELSVKDCISVLEVIATCSIFTSDRVKIIAENLYNQIQDLQKDSYEIIESILTVTLHEMDRMSSSNLKKVKTEHKGEVFENVISMFNQKGFLKKISRGGSEVMSETLKCLELIKGHVLNGLKSSSFVQIGSKSSVLEKENRELSSLDMQFRRGRDNFDVSQLPKFGHLRIESAQGVAYSIGDITASYLSFVVPCNVLPSENVCEETIKEYVSISLICQLLSVTEGPIYSAIRGRGLAYDASLTISLWNGLLTFAVNDSNDPVNAFKEFQKLMQNVDQEFKECRWNIISEDSLKVAKSAFLYQMIEESATPASMFNSCLRNYLRSIPMASSSKEKEPVMEVIRAVSHVDLTKAWFKHFPALLSGNAMAVLVVPKSVSNDILKQFEGLIDFELKSFNDFAIEYFNNPIECEDESEEDSEEGSEDDISDISEDDSRGSEDSEDSDCSDDL